MKNVLGKENHVCIFFFPSLNIVIINFYHI